MKTGTIISIILFVLGALLILAQLWFTPFEAVLFNKLLITIAVLFVVVLGVSIAKREYIDEKKMKDSDYID